MWASKSFVGHTLTRTEYKKILLTEDVVNVAYDDWVRSISTNAKEKGTRPHFTLIYE